MSLARMKFLEKNEEDIIHSQSIKVLAEIGIKVKSPDVRNMLKDAGASVDQKTGVVKIPESLVNESLKKAPHEFTLYGRDSKHDLHVPVDDIPFVGTTGLSIHMTDMETGKQRYATVKDAMDFAKLSDALPQVDFLWSMIIPRDVPEGAHTAHEVWIGLTNSLKHFQQVECRNAADARMQVKLASLIVGGEDELKKKPIFSVIVSPDSPLVLRKEAIEAQVELARAGVPIVSMTMPLSGLTAPVTIAGTLVIVNAENLASLVVTQLAAPGCPHMYSSDAVPGDMTSGDVAYEAVEVPMIFAALGQMAKRYRLPSMVGDWGLCAGSTPGIHRSFSEVSSTALDTFSGTDLISGIGSTDVAKGASFEQMIIDSYMWDNWKGFLRKIDINEENAALDVIKAVGHGNTFLMHPHTARNFKKALYFRNKKISQWEATLSDRMVPEAREIAKKMLKEHVPLSIDKDVLKAGQLMIKDYEKSFA
ncbi:MAG: trimethylamine methyltransferase family protein [Thermoplasmata archaeon]|nr:trimethylamine methyltransferase family protein [Thermoplasmata archaeon]